MGWGTGESGVSPGSPLGFQFLLIAPQLPGLGCKFRLPTSSWVLGISIIRLLREPTFIVNIWEDKKTKRLSGGTEGVRVGSHRPFSVTLETKSKCDYIPVQPSELI